MPEYHFIPGRYSRMLINELLKLSSAEERMSTAVNPGVRHETFHQTSALSKPAGLLLFIVFFLVVWATPSSLWAEGMALDFPVQGKHGMVVTGQELATMTAIDVLKQGGNAVDAAVTAAFVMSVTLPRAGNIGGGGFMLIYNAKNREFKALDFWPKAPTGAHRAMYTGKDGKVDLSLRRNSHLGTAVPGTVAGLSTALEKYGTISLSQAIAPAILYAEEGFILSDRSVSYMRTFDKMLRAFPATAAIFIKRDGSPYAAGDLFVQKDLAKTLKLISKEGPRAFYEGAIADMIANQMKANGGIVTKEDLRAYRAVFTPVVRGTYRGHEVVSVYPPSTGGILLVQLLNILEGFDIAGAGHNSAAAIHLTAEAMNRAFADLNEYIGDPAFSKVPIKGLTSKAYAALLRKDIDPLKATPAALIRARNPFRHEKDNTTHFSVIDRDGNIVSCTYTLNAHFGSGIVVGGAGFLLNDEMDNFNHNPGKLNKESGYVETEANAIAARKRMTTAMSPVIVMKDGKPVIVTGAAGSERIISTNLQVIMNIIDHGMNAQEAVNAPRIHSGWPVGELRIEKGVSPDTVRILGRMGQKVKLQGGMSATSTIAVDPKTGMRYGAGERRREGLALGY